MKPMGRWLFAGLLGVLVAGCSSEVRGPYTTGGEATRDIVKAEISYRKAVAAQADNSERAEQLLRETLTYDLYHGPAHNNLGVLLLGQGKLYEAAEEFAWARKLLPGHPEPRVNLAIAWERGGRYQDALEAAKSALEAVPGNLPAIQAVAVIQVREGLTDATTPTHLDAIIARNPDPKWQEWARRSRLALDAKAAAN